jgi:hypothetical protein
MKLTMNWSAPVPLAKGEVGIYTLDLGKIPRAPGVYIFARKWGGSYEALYVGRSKRLRGRIRGHLNNLRLMQHLANSKTGKRVLIYGVPITKPGQQQDKVLASLEKAFIRHFLLEGHDLVNSQGTRIRNHEIESVGKVPKTFIPSVIYLERGKGE